MNIRIWTGKRISEVALPEGCALIRFADTKEQLIEPLNTPAERLDIIGFDVDHACNGVQPVETRDYHRILEFYERNKHRTDLVVQCQAGVGRSQAAAAALTRVDGRDETPVLRRGTYNRELYRGILRSARIELDPDPLVSIVCRVKYDLDRVRAMMLCMQRQRYEFWELLCVTDGPMVDDRWYDELFCDDPRVKLIDTPERKGYWGHPYRQLGIDAAQGKYIGLTNDDNYYVPGYIEQMVAALQDEQSDLAVCISVHRYSGWGICAGGDLGAWIADRELLKKCPWPGNHFTADQDHMRLLIKESKKVSLVKKPLFVKN